jgi:hypothetical protein
VKKAVLFSSSLLANPPFSTQNPLNLNATYAKPSTGKRLLPSDNEIYREKQRRRQGKTGWFLGSFEF